MLPLKMSCKEQRFVIRFLWVKGLTTIPPMPLTRNASSVWRPVIHFGVSSLFRVKKVLLRKNDLAAVLFQ